MPRDKKKAQCKIAYVFVNLPAPTKAWGSWETAPCGAFMLLHFGISTDFNACKELNFQN